MDVHREGVSVTPDRAPVAMKHSSSSASSTKRSLSRSSLGSESGEETVVLPPPGVLNRRSGLKFERTGSFYLYDNQVAGHMPMMSGKRGMLSKPAQRTETSFYEAMNSIGSTEAPRGSTDAEKRKYRYVGGVQPLRGFIPEYFGCVFVDLDLLLKKGIRTRDGTMEYRSGVESPLTSDAFLADRAVRSHTRQLWKRFKKEREHSKKLQFDEEGRCKYIVLEDLNCGFMKPCILDIKMGTQQHGLCDSAEKIARKKKKCRETTSFTTGLRICGMQVHQNGGGGRERSSSSHRKRQRTWDETGEEEEKETGKRSSLGEIVRKDKMWGRTLKVEDLSGAIELFLSDKTGLRTEVIDPFLKRLNLLKELVFQAKGWRFFSCSLLLTYDAGKLDKLDVRMIDFAHTVYTGEKTPDMGMLLGLQNIIALFANVQHRALGKSDEACFIIMDEERENENLLLKCLQSR